jgi:transglutaminase-like putative cysteine protease
MRIKIHHETKYSYEAPAQSMIQILRLTPRDYDGQYVRRWRVDVDHGGVLKKREDAFGNIVFMLSGQGPISEFTLTVDGEVETVDTAGIVRGGAERFPPPLYLRETWLTRPDENITAFAQAAASSGGGGRLDLLHRLLAATHRQMVFDIGPTDAATTAAQAFALGRGVCQDLSHVFIAAARSLGIPCRYVGGYLLRSDGTTQQEAGHAWAEAFLPDLGWVGFDPANGISPTDAYIRVAIGLDYLGAAPVRGSQVGGVCETLDVAVNVSQASSQRQS